MTPDCTWSKTDLLLESSLFLLKYKPLHAPADPLRLLKQKGSLKTANHPINLLDAGTLLRNNEFSNNSATSTPKGIHLCR